MNAEKRVPVAPFDGPTRSGQPVGWWDHECPECLARARQPCHDQRFGLSGLPVVPHAARGRLVLA
jgi:hypothetical protein